MKKTIYAVAIGLGLTITGITSPPGAAAATDNEISELKQRIEALEKENKAASWSEKIKIKADLRARFEHVEKDSDTSKNRLRGRARVGVYGKVNDQVKAGVRIATGSDDSPTSTNQSLEDFANKRAIWLDLMYMAYQPNGVDGLDVRLGKIKQPWTRVSDLMYDSDVNPEGLNLSYNIAGDFGFTANLGYFIWEDKVHDGSNPATDASMVAGQLAGKFGFDSFKTTLGANAFYYQNIQDTEIPTNEGGTKIFSKGNSNYTVTPDPEAYWLYDYELAQAFIKCEFKPLTIYGDYIVNTASDVENDTAWLVGVGLKAGDFKFDYNYREIEDDAIIGLLADSDFGGGGTGNKGHKFKLKYKLLKNWTAGLTYLMAEEIDGDTEVNTTQLDLMAKF